MRGIVVGGTLAGSKVPGDVQGSTLGRLLSKQARIQFCFFERLLLKGSCTLSLADYYAEAPGVVGEIFKNYEKNIQRKEEIRFDRSKQNEIRYSPCNYRLLGRGRLTLNSS